jgi:hypothetical protein
MPTDTQEIGVKEIQKMQRLALRDPDVWCESAFNIKLWVRQADILRSVFANVRTVVRSCSGSGKSFTAANVVLCFLYNLFPSTIITTAPTFRQVKSILWREIAGLYRKAPQLGGNLTETQLDLTEKWFAIGLSTDQPERFAGLHNENVLVIGDEGSGLPPEVYQAIENPMSTGNAHELLIGNPTQQTGAFRDAFESEVYNKFHISAFDTPNFTELGITLEDIRNGAWEAKVVENRLPTPYLITPRWVRERWEEWGEDSYQWLVYVMGEFPETGVDNVFPLKIVERGMGMGRPHPAFDQMNLNSADPQTKICALDVSRYGEDETVFATRIGGFVLDFVAWSHQDLTYTTGRTLRQMKLNMPSSIAIDSVGLGVGVHDGIVAEFQGNKYNVPKIIEFNAGNKAIDSEVYGNRRAEIYFNIRRMLENDELQLPNDGKLKKELVEMRYYYNRKGQVFIESKEEARARGVKSPDRADALMMLFAGKGKKKGSGMNVRYY